MMTFSQHLGFDCFWILEHCRNSENICGFSWNRSDAQRVIKTKACKVLETLDGKARGNDELITSDIRILGRFPTKEAFYEKRLINTWRRLLMQQLLFWLKICTLQIAAKCTRKNANNSDSRPLIVQKFQFQRALRRSVCR